MRHHRRNPRRFTHRSAVCGCVCVLLTFLAGCKTNNRYDLIESELRTREKELADTRAALDQSRNLLRAYEASQRPAPTNDRQPGATGTSGGAFFPVKEIAIARGTGGVDDDGVPGDEGLVVVIVPKDEDGSAVKVPARALIAAWEITPAGLKNPIGSWNLSADKLRPTWKSGLISTGYFVAVPWQTLPSTDRVRIAVRLVTTDGRTFEADRDITVKPPAPPRAGAGGNVLPYPQPTAPDGPRVPTIPTPPGSGGGRQPIFPEMPPPGVPSTIPPGTEELPPPAPSNSERGARLLPPERP
ncbi:hypothetical protein J8F10_17865 [Gemmata sp. G18]|uniref:Uncharacterized protein n=1 Tax=Gemmata palustris TaxID=2822762 RepID=A0ABS5BTZ4_9BACT|nr:hypothetical protein [Gemmata palustris]MBP3957135.1 hypothetical protein [Gemmata palustris]